MHVVKCSRGGQPVFVNLSNMISMRWDDQSGKTVIRFTGPHNLIDAAMKDNTEILDQTPDAILAMPPTVYPAKPTAG